MKKTIALFLSAIMLMSMGMLEVFAASTNAVFSIPFTGATVTTASSAGDETFYVYLDDGTEAEFTSKKALSAGDGAQAIAKAFAGAQTEVRYGGILYTMVLTEKSIDSSRGVLSMTVYPAGKVGFTVSGAGFSSNISGGSVSGSSITYSLGTGGLYEDTIDIAQVLYSDSSGVAVPLVESKSDLNGTGDGVKSGVDVYFLVNAPFDNDTYFKLKTTKGTNSKNIDSIDVVSKYFTSELYKVYGGTQLSGGITTGRHTFIRVSLKELYTDDEYKITFDLKVSLTSEGEDKYPEFEETSISASDVTAIWLKNEIEDGDGEYSVGESGKLIQPLENEWNEIIWYNEERDLARLYFFADSDTDAFYSKLSTKWEHADYASYFNDQDAYIFDFTGSPSLSSTSRADLEIYNPFVDEDGEETIDPETITVYQVVDGDLYDVTDSFTYEEGDNGEMAYTTRTRFLGTYIFCEKPVAEAEDEDFSVEDYTGEDTDVYSPDTSSGAKVPANTGRYED